MISTSILFSFFILLEKTQAYLVTHSGERTPSERLYLPRAGDRRPPPQP
jgi:hypothetical protein